MYEWRNRKRIVPVKQLAEVLISVATYARNIVSILFTRDFVNFIDHGCRSRQLLRVYFLLIRCQSKLLGHPFSSKLSVTPTPWFIAGAHGTWLPFQLISYKSYRKRFKFFSVITYYSDSYFHCPKCKNDDEKKKSFSYMRFAYNMHC